MRDNGNYFKHFLEVHPGGGSRRNPKRKNAGSYATRANTAPPSVADIDGVFEGHLHRMAKGGTYGDNMELVAFSKALHVDVTIYQRKFAYQVYANNAPCGLPNLHIAYHVSCQHGQCHDPRRLMPGIGLRTLLFSPQHTRSSLGNPPHRAIVRINRGCRRSKGAAGQGSLYCFMDG